MSRLTSRVNICLLVVCVAAALMAGACSSSAPKIAAPSRSSVAGSAGTAATAPPVTTGARVQRVAGAVSTGPCAPARALATGMSAQTFTYMGVKRTYELYVPASYDGARAVPLVFDFHGFGSDAIQQMIYGDFRPLADRDGFLIVAPDGQAAPGGRHFNLTAEPGLQNDVAFVLALLDHAESSWCVDSRRVYSTGMSDGGAMTSALACQAADRFAAFGAVAVIVYVPGCSTQHPVAIMAFSGTADPVVPFNGGQVHCCGGATLGSAPAAMAGWAAAERCQAEPTELRLGTQVRLREWTGCRSGAAVEFYIIDGGGHTWPGSAIKINALGLTTDQVNASQTIWSFFQAHTLGA